MDTYIIYSEYKIRPNEIDKFSEEMLFNNSKFICYTICLQSNHCLSLFSTCQTLKNMRLF